MMRIFTPLLMLAFLAMPGNVFAQSHATVSAALNVSALAVGQAAQLAVVLDIPAGFHAQSHTPLDSYAIKCQVIMEAVPGIQFGKIVYPPGKIEEYAQLGKLSVYTGQATIFVPISITEDVKPGTVKLAGRVQMQICDNNTCFAPESSAFAVETQAAVAGTHVEPRNQQLFANEPTTAPSSQPATSDQGSK